MHTGRHKTGEVRHVDPQRGADLVGGSHRLCRFALQQMGCRDISVHNRTHSKAETLATDFAHAQAVAAQASKALSQALLDMPQVWKHAVRLLQQSLMGPLSPVSDMVKAPELLHPEATSFMGRFCAASKPDEHLKDLQLLPPPPKSKESKPPPPPPPPPPPKSL